MCDRKKRANKTERFNEKGTDKVWLNYNSDDTNHFTKGFSNPLAYNSIFHEAFL